MKRQTDRQTDRETHGLSRGVGLQRLRLSCFRAVVRGFGRASLCPWGLSLGADLRVAPCVRHR